MRTLSTHQSSQNLRGLYQPNGHSLTISTPISWWECGITWSHDVVCHIHHPFYWNPQQSSCKQHKGIKPQWALGWPGCCWWTWNVSPSFPCGKTRPQSQHLSCMGGLQCFLFVSFQWLNLPIYQWHEKESWALTTSRTNLSTCADSPFWVGSFTWEKINDEMYLMAI